MIAPLSGVPIIVGTPFLTTGRGSTSLSHFRALREARVPVRVCDVNSREYGAWNETDIPIELGDSLVGKPGNWINIYHLNADEIAYAQAKLEDYLPDSAYNIIYPFWELSRYPAEWLPQINLFDEIWAPSRFIGDSFAGQISKPITHMPLPVGMRFASFQDRNYFDLPPTAYVFLFFFDFRSYINRKNPQALLKVFERVLDSRPYADVRIVIKVNGNRVSDKTRQDYQAFLDEIQNSSIPDRILLIDEEFSENGIRNLVRCCDCFVSLHRSEGFGLGLAEAMYLGKPVIGTAYSGNMDFMDPKIAMLLDYKLIPVEDGEYPYPEGQVWAEPDVDQAAQYARKLLDEPDFGRELGRRASRYIRTHFSYLAMGLRYKARLEEIARSFSPVFTKE